MKMMTMVMMMEVGRERRKRRLIIQSTPLYYVMLLPLANGSPIRILDESPVHSWGSTPTYNPLSGTCCSYKQPDTHCNLSSQGHHSEEYKGTAYQSLSFLEKGIYFFFLYRSHDKSQLKLSCKYIACEMLLPLLSHDCETEKGNYSLCSKRRFNGYPTRRKGWEEKTHDYFNLVTLDF